MPASKSPEPLRPKADGKSPVGILRYRLLKAAFAHAQHAIEAERYLEAIPILESIILDRLASLVGGSLGYDINLQWTIGRLCQLVEKNNVAEEPIGRGNKCPLPDEVARFILTDARQWFKQRNHAVHGMAKLHHPEDDDFLARYSKLKEVSLHGIQLLVEVDRIDIALKTANSAGRSATWPDALNLTPHVKSCLSAISAQARYERQS